MAQVTVLDFAAILAELRAAAPAAQGYTETDRYREFRSVFLDTPAGQRVLWHIMDMGGLLGTTFDPNPHVHAQNEGWRNLAIRIFQITYIEPKAKPTRQNIKKDN